MRCVCLSLVLVVAVAAAASPLTNQKVHEADHLIHEVARSVKASQLSEQAKAAQLANLKTMDMEVESVPSLSGVALKKAEHMLDMRLQNLKSQVASSSAPHSAMPQLGAVPQYSMQYPQNMMAQYQQQNPMAQYQNPMAQYQNPMAQYQNPMAQYQHPMAQFQQQQYPQFAAQQASAPRFPSAATQQFPQFPQFPATPQFSAPQFPSQMPTQFPAQFPSQMTSTHKRRASRHTAPTAHEPTSFARVQKDIESLRQSLEESSLSDQQQQGALKNLQAISRDSQKLQSFHNTQAKQDLGKALGYRLDALEALLKDPVASADETASLAPHITFPSVPLASTMATKAGKYALPATNFASQAPKTPSALKAAALSVPLTPTSSVAHQHHFEEVIRREVNEIERQLSPSGNPEAMHNLEGIKIDAAKLESAKSGKEETALTQALGLRIQALREEMGVEAEAEDEDEQPMVVGKQEQQEEQRLTSADIKELTQVKQQVMASVLDAKTKREAVSDVESMISDVRELGRANGEREAEVARAIGLRMSALNEMLEQAKVPQPEE